MSRLVRAALVLSLIGWLIAAGLTPTEWLSAMQLILFAGLFYTGVHGWWVSGALHRSQLAYLTQQVEAMRRERDAYAALLAGAAHTTAEAVDSISELVTLLAHSEDSV